MQLRVLASPGGLCPTELVSLLPCCPYPYIATVLRVVGISIRVPSTDSKFQGVQVYITLLQDLPLPHDDTTLCPKVAGKLIRALIMCRKLYHNVKN